MSHFEIDTIYHMCLKTRWKKNAIFEQTIDMYLRFKINRSFFFARDINDVAFTTRLC